MVKVLWNGAIAVGMVIGFFVVRSASSVEHGLRTGWYIAHGDAVWYQLVCVAGFLLFGGACIKAFRDLTGAGPSPVARREAAPKTDAGAEPVTRTEPTTDDRAAKSATSTAPALSEDARVGDAGAANTPTAEQQREDW